LFASSVLRFAFSKELLTHSIITLLFALHFNQASTVLMALIPALQKDHVLQKDVQQRLLLQHTEGGQPYLWWLGQSGFLLAFQGKTVLFDPYLSDSLTLKYAQTDKPHVRLSERAIDPDLLTDIHIVTSSHNHTDHLDAETLQPIFKNNPDCAFIIPEANRAFVCERVQCAMDFPIGLNDGLSVELHGFKITGVPAAHNALERDAAGQCKYMGFVVEFGDFSLYHSGDTLWYEGMVDILKPFRVDIACLPINGNLPERRVAGNLNATEAAELGKAIGAKYVVPHHYDLFAFNTADVNHFVAAAAAVEQPYRVLRIGEGFSL
jgi:L-ascorbate metabolism protein UlaG (beta-lactamase superfamily)